LDDDNDAEVVESAPKAMNTDKGKGKAVEVEEEGAEGDDVAEGADDEADEDYIEGKDADIEKLQGLTTERNPLDTLCNQAIIAICRINILKPPVPMVFGTWNQRPLRESEAKKLAKEMEFTKFSPFNQSNLLPLIISPMALQPSCVHKDLDAESAPLLELTEEVIAKGQKLQFAGGRHRLRATQLLHEKAQGKLSKLQDKLNKLRDAEGKEDKVESVEQLLQKEQEAMEQLGLWGVLVYDEGETFHACWRV
jgi:hypothetical protein